jgi:hypothetical protein
MSARPWRILLVLTAAALLPGPGARAAGPTPAVSSAISLAASPDRAAAGLSDFNGDGYGDLVMAYFGEDVGTVKDAGAVAVLYGSRSGLQANGRGGPDDQFWTQGSGGVADRAEPGDQFGWTVAYGDFNGDRFADLAVGVPFEDVGGVSNAGAVEILYGSPTGLQANGAGGPDDQFWTRGSGGMLGHPASGDAFGRSLAVDDFNADGYADIAVGGQREGVAGVDEAGGVEILYGSAAGLQANGAGGPDDQFWTQDSPGVRDRTEAGDWFGRSLATGDFNGDGYADLAAGAPFEDLGSARDAGAVQILYGSSPGLQAGGGAGPDDQFWTQDLLGPQAKSESGDLFGRNLAGADFNGDGFGDLAISVRKQLVGSSADAGAVDVLYGGPSGLQPASPAAQLWTQDSQGVLDQAEAGDVFGRAVLGADFNADGLADLAVGVPFEEVAGIKEAGAVEVLYGSPKGLQAEGAGAPDDQLWVQGQGGVKDRAEPGDRFGVGLSAADFDGDGPPDLAVAVLFEDVGQAADAGAYEVLYATTGQGLQSASPDDQFWTQDSPGVEDRAEPGDGGYASNKPFLHRLALTLGGALVLLLFALAMGVVVKGRRRPRSGSRNARGRPRVVVGPRNATRRRPARGQ